MELNGKKINFLGDSITEGAGVEDLGNTFWNILSRRTGAICRGYGIGGTRIARVTTPSAEPVYDLDFNLRADQMDDDADIVVVFGGTNDFGHGDAPMGTPDDREEHTFYGAMHCLCRKLLSKYPDGQIVFMTPTHRLGETLPKNGTGGTLYDYVRVIKEVTLQYSIPVLDLFAVSGIQPEIEILQQKFMPDGLHPNDAGHQKIAEKLIGFLGTL